MVRCFATPQQLNTLNKLRVFTSDVLPCSATMHRNTLHPVWNSLYSVSQYMHRNQTQSFKFCNPITSMKYESLQHRKHSIFVPLHQYRFLNLTYQQIPWILALFLNNSWKQKKWIPTDATYITKITYYTACPAGWSVYLPLLIFPCTINSRSSLLALAHLGGLGKWAVKWLWWYVVGRC